MGKTVWARSLAYRMPFTEQCRASHRPQSGQFTGEELQVKFLPDSAEISLKY
jgi:hypothetical protein